MLGMPIPFIISTQLEAKDDYAPVLYHRLQSRWSEWWSLWILLCGGIRKAQEDEIELQETGNRLGEETLEIMFIAEICATLR